MEHRILISRYHESNERFFIQIIQYGNEFFNVTATYYDSNGEPQEPKGKQMLIPSIEDNANRFPVEKLAGAIGEAMYNAATKDLYPMPVSYNHGGGFEFLSFFKVETYRKRIQQYKADHPWAFSWLEVGETENFKNFLDLFRGTVNLPFRVTTYN